jgi:CheY-like chemotaxis protein
VAARSEGLGKGSEFIVRLPLASKAAQLAHAERPVPEKSGPPPRRRVLVVDDNVDAADSLAELLVQMDQDVQVARDAASAMTLAASFRPEVVFLDLGLPDMDGYQVAELLRSSARPGDPRMKLVALSGYGQDADRRKTRSTGFDLHLVKPADATSLINVLRRDPEGP